MRFLDNLITCWAERIHSKTKIDRWYHEEVPHPTPKRSGRGKTQNTTSNRRVEHNYDDESVITFKIYGANGGKIVETSRYDDVKDNESIRRYVISEDSDLTESLSKIVTMEYMR